MKLARAQECAKRLVDWLLPFADRVEVAGSVRRGKAEVGDIDLLIIPRLEEQRDMLGEVVARRNATWVEINRRITEKGWTVQRAGAEIVSFTAADVQVDIFWTTEERWGTALLCRTGSKEHNIWLATYAQTRGMKWNPGLGLYHAGRRYSETEEGIYKALGIDFIPPEKREINLLPYASLYRSAAAGGSDLSISRTG